MDTLRTIQGSAGSGFHLMSSLFPERSVFPGWQVSVLSMTALCLRSFSDIWFQMQTGEGRYVFVLLCYRHVCTALSSRIWYLWAHRSGGGGWARSVTLPLTFRRCLHPRCHTHNELSGGIPSGSVDQLDMEQTGTNWSQPAYDERGPRAERTPPGTRFTGEDVNGAGFQAGTMCLPYLEDGLC